MGPLKNPDIVGAFRVPKTAFTISFLQTDYNLVNDPLITINNENISFPDLELKDTKFGTKGILSGNVKHKNFSDFNLNLRIEADELLVLNTDASRDDAYYGTAFATGALLITGSPEDLLVDAAVSSARQSTFNIPIGGASEIKQSGFVRFVSPQSTEKELSVFKDLNYEGDEGVTLDFDITINQDAQVSIILDESTGNKLNAKGEGLIKLRMEPNRDLELFGTYTLAQGLYRFNLEGLLNKDFLVQQGGTVAWDGDPYQARLDLTAIYSTRADPTILLGEDLSTGLTPVEVYLEISGLLTNPDINFEVKIPRANSTAQAVLSNRLNNENAINQQVFSLLAFNSFTPPSNIITGSAVGINEWDFIANQAAAFLNRFTGGYEFSLSYQPATVGPTSDQQQSLSQEELEVGLSKDFFNDRLTVNSSVEVPLNENNNSIAGDFELIYSLTEDGRLRASAFNRSVNQQLDVSFGQQQLYKQGVGLQYRVDFENYAQLLGRMFRFGSLKEADNPSLQED
jgi:hypothetical protein